MRPEDIERIMGIINHNNYSPDTVEDYKSTLKVYYRFVFGLGKNDPAPETVRWIPRKKPESKLTREEIVTPEQVDAMIRICNNPRDKCLIGLLGECGLRPGEARSICIGDITKKQNAAGIEYYKIHVTGKTGQGDVFLMTNAGHLSKWLNEHKHNTDKNAPLFCNLRGSSNKVMSQRNLSVVVAVASKNAIGREIKPYVLRHSAATYWTLKKVPEAVIKKAMRHSENSRVLSRYQHLVSEDLEKEMSDFFCRLVYGNAFSKRELYSDTEEIVMQMRRAIGLNGINLASEEADLLDRSLEISLTRISKEERRSESELWNNFRQDQPKITGAILKILQKTILVKESVEVKELPRMADFALWGEAVSRAIGEVPGIFLNDYWTKIEGLNQAAIEANPVGMAILELMREKDPWEGSASDLLDELTKIAERLKINTKYRWPSAPNVLTRKLNEIQTNLQGEGYDLRVNKGSKGIRKILIKKVAGNTASIATFDTLRHRKRWR